MPEPQLQRQQSVYQLLKQLRGLEPLKKLFLTELNYARVNQPLSRRGWPEPANNVLAEDPLLLASGGDKFEIIYARLKSDALLKTDERAVVSHLLKNHPYSLFVFSNKAQDRWHFVNVKPDVDVSKRRVFRRITVGREEQLRTASERVAMLDLESVRKNLFGLSPLEIQSRHDEAFDVEPVTQEFFKKYREVFEKIEELITGFKNTDAGKERKRLFTQRLFNRLMFIAFIQKKGWLSLNGDYDYLNALWEAHRKENSSDKNFYRDRLKLLFFHALNTSNEVNLVGINKGGFLSTIVGQVVYLNGGLFEEDEDDKDFRIAVPDKAIDAVLNELFSRFNFTITESTPLDIEVAVDPEMLGKIFEELVTGRHETGSYYTPKPIVSFMCREALKGYLETRLPTENKIALEQFVDEHKPEGIGNAEAVLEALRRITVCDPACGSGAYPLGMLHELLDLRACLFATKKLDAVSTYDRKLEIIQRNLYGVDIDPFAINIARLRLWLSLTVEFEGENPPTLPNLDYKVEVGDSLSAPNPSGGLEMGFREGLIDSLLRAKAEFLTAHHGHKTDLKRQIEKLKSDIRSFTHTDGAVDGFDWPVEFAEVFIDGGFDVVLANPPYGAIVEDGIRDLYFDKRIDGSQSKDTYGLFMARALQLMRPDSQFCFITSDTWRTIKTHRPLRRKLLAETTIRHFLDLPPWIFDATVNTCILALTSSKAKKDHRLVAGDLRTIELNDWNALDGNLRAVALQGPDVQTKSYARYTYKQNTISEYENCSFFIASPQIYRIFYDPRLTRLGNIAEVKQGLATADNQFYLRKRPEARGSYLLIDAEQILSNKELAELNRLQKTEGVDPKEFGGRRFVPFDKGGESDTDEGWLPNYFVPTDYFIDWSKNSVMRLKTATIADVKRRKGQLEKIRPSDEKTKAAVIRNPEYFFRPGISFSPTGVYSPSFRIGCSAVFGNKGSTIFFLGDESTAVLGVLTSTAARYLLKNYLSHTVETGEDVLNRLVLPVFDKTELATIAQHVEQVIEKQKKNPRYAYYADEQRQIDEIVFRLYDFSENEVIEMKKWYCRRYPRLAKAQGVWQEVPD